MFVVAACLLVEDRRSSVLLATCQAAVLTARVPVTNQWPVWLAFRSPEFKVRFEDLGCIGELSKATSESGKSGQKEKPATSWLFSFLPSITAVLHAGFVFLSVWRRFVETSKSFSLSLCGRRRKPVVTTLANACNLGMRSGPRSTHCVPRDCPDSGL
jgi:hypothetical protein